MSDKTRAEMITLVLQRLGVVGQGQSASADDSAVTGEVIDSVHSRLRKDRLAPFATSAFPDWAQVSFADIAASELLVPFGVGGERAQLIRAGAVRGRMELARQVASYRHNVPVRGHFY